MKRLLISAVIAAMSVNIWGQSKLSPYTRYFVETVKHSASSADIRKLKSAYCFRTDATDRNIVIPAFVHLYEGYSPDMLKDYGVKVRTVIGNVLTADIPLDALDKLSALDGVRYIEMGTPVTSSLDKARKDTRVDDVQNGVSLPAEYRGKDVVVGVVDNGFEFGHPNFYTRDKSELRIKRVWDQNASGNAPEGFDYGCEYTTADEILARAYDTNSSTHGTHVLGIAAGADNTGDKNVYGVATDADIVLVSLNGNELINADNTTVIDGVKYIFDYAKSVNKPCVVNLSLGSHLGPRDGSSTFDMLTDEMLGPGRIIVGAAGNDGGAKCHVGKTFEGEKADTIATFLDFKYIYPQSGTAEIWCDKGMNIKFVPFVLRANGNTIKQVYEPAVFNTEQCDNRTYNFNLATDSVSGDLTVEGEVNPLNGKVHLMLSFDYLNSPDYRRGIYVISSDKGDVNMWTENMTSQFSNYNVAGYEDGNDDMTVGEIGGTGKRIVSVGAYVTCDHSTQYGIPHYIDETVNALASFSSHGPTADGRLKPEVAAPGAYIVSSLSSYYTGSKVKYCTISWNGNKYEYGYMLGTSMASPFVAGVVATWLQANPGLTPEDVVSILQKTSRRDSFTGDNLPTYLWGYGKLDAYEGIKESLLCGTGIETGLADAPHMIVCDGHDVRIVMGYADSDIHMQLYNMQGECVASSAAGSASAGEELTFALPGAANGIYIFKMSGKNTKQTVKKIIIQ